MKKLLYLLTVCLLTGLAFSSCGDDGDDEVFYTGNQAKEAIKNTWKASSMKMKSNNALLDGAMNTAFNEMFKQGLDSRLTFETDVVRSTITFNDGVNESVTTVESYRIENNILYVDDTILGETLSHSFQVSDKTLILIQKNVDREMMKKIFLNSGATESDIQQIMTQIPLNFSAEIVMTLNKI